MDAYPLERLKHGDLTCLHFCRTYAEENVFAMLF